MQAAFIEEDGFQCGYCTSGQITSAIGCVMEGNVKSDAEIREYMSGNLCRCGADQGIVNAVKRASDETGEIQFSALTMRARYGAAFTPPVRRSLAFDLGSDRAIHEFLQQLQVTWDG
jgi:xanthine dehydrogenase iron-sulfur cluster and FAD-binding subunit A